MNPVLKHILEVLSVFGLSTVKYVAGIFLSTATYNQGFIPSVLLTVAGGMTGFYVFAFFETALENLYHRIRGTRKSNKIRYNRFTRWLVRIRSRYGLAGIAMLTPILLQVPIGTFIAIRLTHKFHKVSLYMLASFFVTSLVLCGLYYGLHDYFESFARHLPHFLKGN